MQAFSAVQRALLDARDDRVKMAIEIDDTTPIRRCTGADPIQIDSDWYDPGLSPRSFNKIALTNPMTSRTSIVFPDQDGAIRTQWYSTKLDCSATVHWLLRSANNVWTEVLTIAWAVKECGYDKSGDFTINLSAAAGSRPRSGGMIGSHDEFPYAPEPGEAFRLGHSGGGVTFRPGVGSPPPPPGGKQQAYDPRNTQSISDGPSLRDRPTPPSTPGGGQQQQQSGPGSGSQSS